LKKSPTVKAGRRSPKVEKEPPKYVPKNLQTRLAALTASNNTLSNFGEISSFDPYELLSKQEINLLEGHHFYGDSMTICAGILHDTVNKIANGY
jgi:hypothetical protein